MARFMVALLFLVRQRSESHQGVEVVKDLGHLPWKGGIHGRRRREFASNDPRQNLFPILRRGRPTCVLCPFALHGCVPVAFVAAAEALLLLRGPGGIRVYARLGNQRKRGLLALPSRIDSKARGDRI